MRQAYLLLLLVGGCATSNSSGPSQESSQPLNAKEQIDYKRALVHCHKTGGSRVVKIEGQLRCY